MSLETENLAESETQDPTTGKLHSAGTPASDPFHGVTLEQILTELVAHHGWKAMGELVKIKCFLVNPSIKSSLTFLRRTPWARRKVEIQFLRLHRYKVKQSKKIKLEAE